MPRSLQDELKQRKPFVSLEHEAVLSIARSAARLEHQAAEALKPHGVTPTQYNALRILRGAGAAGLCRNEIRDRLVARVPDATRLLDRLEAMGLVVREREGEDRRFVRTRITPPGRAVLARLDGPIAALHERQLGHLGPGRLRTLIDLLALAREAPSPRRADRG
jgi:DNA-binding MarR family transcriptional regulator